jgi:DNA-binding NtrC family response regulator
MLCGTRAAVDGAESRSAARLPTLDELRTLDPSDRERHGRSRNERARVMTSPTGDVLLVDDNAEFSYALAQLAARARCEVTAASDISSARELASARSFDLLMIDLELPDGNGLDLLDHMDLATQGEIVIVTGNPSIETAMRAVKSPVVEYLVKPVATETISTLMARAHARAQARRPAAAAPIGGMLGSSAPMRDVFDRIRRVAPMDVCVLIHGESGTGKELAARALHDLSGRDGPFVAVNCGAITSDLLGSHLFGHERGSFTGALNSHAGFFEQAQGGTLFLDEIAEMPPALQVYLLRVLETKRLTRIGGAREIPLDVRIVAATNRVPAEAVAEGKLRSDLQYRLIEFPLELPPLRERREDIPELARHFLDRLNARYGTRREFAADALRTLAARAWPGNIRELRHTVQRLYIMAGDGPIQADPEPPVRSVSDGDGAIRFSVGMSFDDVEREMLLKTLAYYDNNKRQAARALGVTAKTIYNRMLRYRSLNLIDDKTLGAAPDDEADGSERT